MENVSPKLLKACRDDFARRYSSSGKIKAIVNRIRDGTATLKDASEYSSLVGEMLGKAMAATITPDALPEQKLFWNIAQDVIKPLIHENYDLVNVCSEECQRLAYEQAGIGLKVAKPKRNDERIKGLLDDVCADGIDAEQLAYRLSGDIQNIIESFYYDFAEANMERAGSAGLKAKVIRTVGALGCCEWCDSLAGVYDYDEVKDNGDVWRRHVNCSCDITYVTEKSSEKISNYRKIDVTRGKTKRK